MPPNAKFSKIEIIEKAVQIARKDGIDKVTARELGKCLNSSARPVFTVFVSMDEVKQEVINYARDLYKRYVEDGMREGIAFRGVGAAYIAFAMNEPKLFQLLFMKELKDENELKGILPRIDDNYDKILESVQKPYGLSMENAQKMYQHLWIYTHGIAALCADKVCSFTSEEIEQMLTEVFIGLLKEMKRRENS